MALSTSVFYLCSGCAEGALSKSVSLCFPLSLTDNYFLGSLFLNPHPRICFFFIDFRQTGSGRESERNIGWLSPLHAPTRDRAYNLGMLSD